MSVNFNSKTLRLFFMVESRWAATMREYDESKENLEPDLKYREKIVKTKGAYL